MTHPIDKLLQQLYCVSDDDILREFEEAETEVMAEGEPKTDMEGFERLWQKLVKEYEKSRHW